MIFPGRMFCMHSYYIRTFGCQANKSDSERIAGDYQARGFVETDDWRECSELVVNTCAIRQRAEDRVQGFLYNVKLYFQKLDRPRPKIILTGCMTHHGNEKLYKMLPIVDEILPINEVGFNQTAIRKDKKSPQAEQSGRIGKGVGWRKSRKG